jgi:hypothetical protein
VFAAILGGSAPATLPDFSRTLPCRPPINILKLHALAILCGASLSWWCTPVAAFGQANLRPNAVAGGFSAAEGPQELAESLDSLSECALTIEIAKVMLRLGETALWHRIIPKVQCSARLGVGDVIFYDQGSGAAGVQFPRDSYGITLNLSLTEIVDGSRHQEAELDLEKLQAERQKIACARELSRRLHMQKRSVLLWRLPLLQAELAVMEDIGTFDSLRFHQGKIGYDVFRRSLLAVLSVKKQIQDLQEALLEMEYRPVGGGPR